MKFKKVMLLAMLASVLTFTACGDKDSDDNNEKTEESRDKEDKEDKESDEEGKDSKEESKEAEGESKEDSGKEEIAASKNEEDGKEEQNKEESKVSESKDENKDDSAQEKPGKVEVTNPGVSQLEITDAQAEQYATELFALVADADEDTLRAMLPAGIKEEVLYDYDDLSTEDAFKISNFKITEINVTNITDKQEIAEYYDIEELEMDRYFEKEYWNKVDAIAIVGFNATYEVEGEEDEVETFDDPTIILLNSDGQWSCFLNNVLAYYMYEAHFVLYPGNIMSGNYTANKVYVMDDSDLGFTKISFSEFAASKGITAPFTASVTGVQVNDSMDNSEGLKAILPKLKITYDNVEYTGVYEAEIEVDYSYEEEERALEEEIIGKNGYLELDLHDDDDDQETESNCGLDISFIIYGVGNENVVVGFRDDEGGCYYIVFEK